jgi:hypothetical protein
MDNEVAREVVRAVFRSSGELEKLLPVLKKECGAEDYKTYTRQVAMAIDGIHVALLDKVLKQFPELKAEIEKNLARTGRAMP